VTSVFKNVKIREFYEIFKIRKTSCWNISSNPAQVFEFIPGLL